jgi:hypothetical protein
MAAGTLTMVKIWDRSPIDSGAFDPSTPPLPGPPPVNTVPPFITVLTTLEVGQQLVGSTGSWTGASTYTRQWTRDGAPIAGAVTPGYILVEDDVGAMIGFTVVAANGNGSSSAASDPVGPILPAGRAARRS